MSAGPAPTPRSGRLLGGGPNSLELLWATLALVVLAVGAILCLLVYAAVWLDATLAGTRPALELAPK